MASMEPLTLKKSCDSCTSSKVKCTGELPCERCIQKKMQCFYSPRKRRAKPKRQKQASDMGDGGMDDDDLENENDHSLHGHSEHADQQKGGFGFDPSAPMGSLVEWERRSWSVFFTLYKHYGTSCSLHWFNRQLNKMRKYLSRQGNIQSLKRLNAWMEALDIDVETLAAEVERCRIKCFQSRNALTLRVQGTIEEKVNDVDLMINGNKRTISNTMKNPQNSIISANLLPNNERMPYLRLIAEYPGSMREEEEKVNIFVNTAFTSVFGISQKAFEEQLKWTGGGFLPWGGDILARVLTKEKDLLAYVQILAIKFQSLSKPENLPLMRDVPSCHMFEVNIRERASTGNLVPVNALIKCVHREVITYEKCVLEITMEFTPLTPFDHLLDGNSSAIFEDLTDQHSIEIPTLLNVTRPVVPFSTKGDSYATKRKNRASFDISDSENEDDYYDFEAKNNDHSGIFQIKPKAAIPLSSTSQNGAMSLSKMDSFDSFLNVAFDADVESEAPMKERPSSKSSGSATIRSGASSSVQINMGVGMNMHRKGSAAKSVLSSVSSQTHVGSTHSPIPNMTTPSPYEPIVPPLGEISSGPFDDLIAANPFQTDTADEVIFNEFSKAFATIPEQAQIPIINSENGFNEMQPPELQEDWMNSNLFDEQSDWLDGLLDWSSKQDLHVQNQHLQNQHQNQQRH